MWPWFSGVSCIKGFGRCQLLLAALQLINLMIVTTDIDNVRITPEP